PAAARDQIEQEAMTMPLKRRFSKERDFVCTDVAVQVYQEMARCACTCASADDWIRNEECDGCRRWWELQQHLWAELRLRLWQWPAISRNGGAGYYAEAVAVWQALEQKLF